MRILARFLACVGAVVLSAIVVAAGAAIAARVAYGTVEVEVHGAGDDVSIRVPGVLVHAALRLLPADACREAGREARRWVPALGQACRDLARVGDGVLVRAHGRDEDVTVAKRGKTLVVDVNAGGETVHVSVPLRTAAAVIETLGREDRGAEI